MSDELRGVYHAANELSQAANDLARLTAKRIHVLGKLGPIGDEVAAAQAACLAAAAALKAAEGKVDPNEQS